MSDKSLQIGWKVSSPSPDMASVRYRAILPVLALESLNVQSRIFVSVLESDLDGLDAIVIVKCFTSEDVHLAQRARERGILVLFDLCDNIFIEQYSGRRGVATPVQLLDAMASHLDCIVTTTQPLADIVRARYPGVEVAVIPDGIETPVATRRGTQLLRTAAAAERRRRLRLYVHKLRNVLRQMREGGPGAVLPWTGFLVSRGARKIHAALFPKRRKPSVVTSPLFPLPPKASAPRQIVWFGNHGADHASFGMLDLLEIKPALETIASETDVELLVISNNRDKYEKHIKPIKIASRYIEWAPGVVERMLGGASAVVVPNTLDPFSVCKSANRTILGLSAGVPVVATQTPALEALGNWIHTGDPLEGLRRIFADPAAATRQAEQGYLEAERLYGVVATGRAWRALLDGLRGSRAEAVSRQPWLVVVLHLIQDLDLASPILQAAQVMGLETEVWCGTGLIRKSPRVLASLREHKWHFKVIPDEGAFGTPTFSPSTRAVLTVAETNLGPHRFSRKISEAARSAGLYVATMQHGFENVGLTYQDSVHPIEKISFAAQRIYLWGPFATLHPGASPDVRGRCLPVGCPKPAFVPAANLSELVPVDAPVVGVFENLHWHRYSDSYRTEFMRGVARLAAQFPGVCFLVKPHHAGLWLTTRFDGDKPRAPNLVIADPQSPAWENYTAGALLGNMKAVITTPSTVAVDAARRGLPVAVVAGELELPNYAPLGLLRREGDWQAFVEDVLDGSGLPALEAASAGFVERVLVSGDAAVNILNDLTAAAST